VWALTVPITILTLFFASLSQQPKWFAYAVAVMIAVFVIWFSIGSLFDLRTYKEECAMRVILFCETPSASPGAWILGWKRCLHCSFSR
jgi:hypothetical protein